MANVAKYIIGGLIVMEFVFNLKEGYSNSEVRGNFSWKINAFLSEERHLLSLSISWKS